MKKLLLLLFLFAITGTMAYSQTVIYDFETDGTTTEFFYFGSTLADTPAANIANPNPTGVNTSSTVLEYVKAANSETWAGAYANPAPTTPIDATNGGTICIDVHMDHIGVLALKLEASTSGGSNWITTQPNTVVGEWETLCFDLSANGLEDDMTPAAGHIYGQIVIFPDFGSNDVIDVTTYLDNMVLNTTTTTEMSDVTFTVNMGEKTDFGGVFLSGSFNDWGGNNNPMTDDDGDNVWTTTISVLNGTYEYKFQLDEWAESEQFDGSDACTMTSEDGAFTNRLVLITGDVDLGPVCYASCYDCGQSVNITWNLNMQNEEVSDLGVYVAGGPFFGHAELPSMTDEDGDGVYTITLEREIGFTSDYTFLNGICLPDWGCKENIAGQDCAVAPFNDRNLAPVMEDTEINTCFGVCSTDGSCGATVDKYMATFRVDMNNETVGADGVFLSGGVINSWSPDATPMLDDDGNGVYEVTIELPAVPVEFKYVNSGTYEDVQLDDCTVADPSGQFINRILNMTANDTILPSYEFGNCSISTVGVNDLEFVNDLFQIRPSVTSDVAEIVWTGNEERQISIYSISGQLMEVFNMTSNQTSQKINAINYSSGLYFVRMTTDKKVGSQKLVIK